MQPCSLAGAITFFITTLRNTLWLICVLIQLLYCKVAQISEAPFHVFIVQTGTHRINLSTIDVWQLGVWRCFIVDKIDGW